MLNTVIQIASGAGQILMKHYKTEIEVTFKSENNALTKADLESDEYIKNQLRKYFPNDQVLSEEQKEETIDYSKKVWIDDPLDGTKAFIKHIDSFSVMIALCNNGKPIL